MSGINGAAAAAAVASAQQPTSPARRHQIKRSLSEFTSPGKSSRARKDRTGTAGNNEEGNSGAGAGSSSNSNGNGNGNRHLRQPSAANDRRMSLDMPRSTGFSPVMSPDQSRRGSMLLPLPPKDREEGQRASSTESNDVRLRQNQARIAGNTETLTQSLLELNEFSATASRQLDDAYYAVLEKMSVLHSTVTSLQGLAETSHGIYDTFEKDSRGLENQIATQLGAMGHFQSHQTKVATLQKRIVKGRSRIKALSDRVDTVRQRIETWEQADRQWQERTRKRLKIVWSVMTVVVLVVIILTWTAGISSDERGAKSDPPTDALGRAISILEPFNASDSRQPPGPEGTEIQTRILWKTPVREADRLRVFDEL